MIPYAHPADRARALYRIPTAPQRNRTLEICHAREPLLRDFAWPGGGHRSCVIGSAAQAGMSCPDAAKGLTLASLCDPVPFPQRSFDLVILHCTLDDLAASPLSPNASFDALAFLKKVVAVLVPGGLVAGCVDNRYDSKFFLHGLAQRWRGQGNRHAKAGLSLAKLRSLLDDAQLTDIRLFSLLPGCDSPLRLVDSDPRISRLAFRHELEARREYLSTPSYLARRAVIELGLSRHLESAIFFWGYRAC